MPTFTQALLWLFVIDLGIASGAGVVPLTLLG